MRKILVIGGAGQLARSLAETPVPSGIGLSFVGRPDCDIRSSASVAAAIEREAPQVVLIAAAYTAVDRAEAEEAEAFAVNADGPAHVGAACAGRGIPVIHISTDYVFDGRKAGPYVESDPPAPISAYGRSKLAGEERLAAATPRHVILRTARLHSPFGGNFVKTMLGLAEEREVVEVVDDEVGSPTYAGHLAAVVLALARGLIAESWPSPWGVFHAAGAGGASWLGFAEAIFREARSRGLPSPLLVARRSADFPRPAARPANAWLDNSRLDRTFGLTLPPWQEGVAECVRRLVPARLSDAPRRGFAAGR